MGLFSKPEAYLGVDIGAQGIKLVEFHKVKGRPQLWTYGIATEPLNIHLPEKHEKTAKELRQEDKGDVRMDEKLDAKEEEEKKKLNVELGDSRIEKYAGLLRALIKEARVTTKKAAASLPVSYVFHTIVTLPRVEDKEIDHMVRAEVKKMLPRPIEEMQIVHQKIPESKADKEKKYLRVLVTAAPRELVAFYTAIFQKAGLQLEELETEAFALERSLVGKDKATLMIVDIGAERTNLFIIDQGLPLTHRSINVGGRVFDKILIDSLGIKPDSVGQVKSDISRIQGSIPSDLFVTAIDPIVKEINYNFDLFLHQIGNEDKKPEKIILTGGSAVFPFISEQIKNNFSIKVFVGDPWARVVYQEGMKRILDGIGPRMSVSIGLAMRNIF